MPDEKTAAPMNMATVHGALRRDLARIRTTLTAAPYPQGRQRAAIAAHTAWMMTFLHGHHGGEDAGLWPAVRAKNAAAAPLLDQMDADHRAIGPGIDAVEQAARRYAGAAAGREDLLAAVALLEQTLLPHLRREELEMMPVVAATLSPAELDAIEQEFFIRPKTKVQLGDEGQWLIDNASEQSRQRILGVVPPPLRFALVHVFGPRYRRKRRLLWADGPAAAIPPLPADSTAVTG